MADNAQNNIPAGVKRIVADELVPPRRLVLISSESGHGRNAVLAAEVERHFPDNSVYINATALTFAEELLDYAERLEHAAVVCIDGLGDAKAEVHFALLQLVGYGEAGPYSRKFQHEKILVTVDQPVFILSERTDRANEIEQLADGNFSADEFVRFDLTT